MSIAQLSKRFKAVSERFASHILFGLCLLLTGFIGFGLGSSTNIAGTSDKPEVKVAEIELNSLPASAYAALQQEEQGSNPNPVSESAPIGGGSATIVVASKSGSRYHYPWCPGAKQIKEENKVFFKTSSEARAAGYTPASNCKGLE